MRIRNALLFAAFLMLASATIAGEKIHQKLDITVDDGTGDGEIRLSLNSDEMGFNLQDLQEGETRSIVDDTGRPILITRTADGFNIDVDGKKIELPNIGQEHTAMWDHGNGSSDVDVHVVRDAKFITRDGSDSVTIISAQPIDDVTREGIKSLLVSSGHNEEVSFIDGSAAHGATHKIRIVKKELKTSL